MRFLRCALLSCLLLSLASCDRLPGASLRLPANPPLSSGLGWALVKDSYVRLKAEPRIAAADLGHLRDGEIIEVLGRETGEGATPGSRMLWYRIRTASGEAWIRSPEATLFASREQAERAKGEGK